MVVPRSHNPSSTPSWQVVLICHVVRHLQGPENSDGSSLRDLINLIKVRAVPPVKYAIVIGFL